MGNDLLSMSEVLLYHNIDYVIGTPSNPAQRQLAGDGEFREGQVDDVWFTLNVESLISSVNKNWKIGGKRKSIPSISVCMMPLRLWRLGASLY